MFTLNEGAAIFHALYIQSAPDMAVFHEPTLAPEWLRG
jgi:hypothetical protein